MLSQLIQKKLKKQNNNNIENEDLNENINFDDFENYYKNHKLSKFLSYKLNFNDLKDLYNSDFDFEKSNLFFKKFYSNKQNKIILYISYFLCIFLRVLFLFSFCGFCYLYLYLLDSYTNLKTSYVIYLFMLLNIVFITFFYLYWTNFRLFNKSSKDDKRKIKPIICRSLIDKFTWNVHFWNLMKFYIKFEKINKFKNEPNFLNDEEVKFISVFSKCCKLHLPYFMEYINFENIDIEWNKTNLKSEKKFKKLSDKKFNSFKSKKNKMRILDIYFIFSSTTIVMFFVRGLLGSFFIPVFLSLFTALIYFYA